MREGRERDRHRERDTDRKIQREGERKRESALSNLQRFRLARLLPALASSRETIIARRRRRIRETYGGRCPGNLWRGRGTHSAHSRARPNAITFIEYVTGAMTITMTTVSSQTTTTTTRSGFSCLTNLPIVIPRRMDARSVSDAARQPAGMPEHERTRCAALRRDAPRRGKKGVPHGLFSTACETGREPDRLDTASPSECDR